MMDAGGEHHPELYQPWRHDLLPLAGDVFLHTIREDGFPPTTIVASGVNQIVASHIVALHNAAIKSEKSNYEASNLHRH